MVNGLGMTELRIEKEVALKYPTRLQALLISLAGEPEQISSQYIDRFKEVAMF
jgi:hypothetical protein